MKHPKPLKKLTRKWLLKFADSIFNPKTKKYLRLCAGELTNGPDPKEPKRTMHCGLGELYYAMTGEVRTTKVGDRESAVVKLAADKAGLEDDARAEFAVQLDSIPGENDSAFSYLTRARRVAKQLRKAAEYLPGGKNYEAE